ncbi:Succinate--CoA ligase [GDP-forming] subunit beta [Fusarium oxysporum f. sp. cubense]|uniref:Succinate--CoA ligase [ADP-forming] subunit beta, mitochondrial n=1 Tax=Fusarium oxysporum f. sp. cubense TaxID=61366 RepID=A0A559L0Z5_FUSOC|nr:Succinate--CoA ligase [GDP-forming] subunit beta [Fusarium oxysporum f. sp. cubense]
MAGRRISQTVLQPKFTLKRQIRYLHLQEYQSQQLLRDFNLPVPRGQVATTASEVREIMNRLGKQCVLKSQILKGGRGKGTFDNGLHGGIHMVRDPAAGEELASKMLGNRLKTKQTSGEGIVVDKLYVAESVKYDEEWYLALTVDREKYAPVVLVSKHGGINVEDNANSSIGSLQSFHFNLSDGITPGLVSRIRKGIGASEDEANKLGTILDRLLQLFISKDATMLEINPLVRTADANFKCLDAKFTFDDASERRQPELFAMRDVEAEVGEELEAQKHGLVYIKMDGNIGNVVNGAGLAMATNDAIAYHGGSSANFLDAGGQATKQTMQKAIEIILRDQRVKVILVNIYGGIIKCDMIAESIIGAAKELGPLRVPLVVRLQGTNSPEGLKILEEANLGFHVESGFGEAAQKAVELSTIV